MTKILYIHDKEDWAIHNVGKLWLENLSNKIFVDFLKRPTLNVLNNYDYVWFGYHTLWLKNYRSFEKNKTIISVHDPCELSGVNKDIIEDRIVVTTSHQMNSFLLNIGIKVNQIIPTTGSLEYKDIIKNEKEVKLFTISSSQNRKNISSIQSLFERCSKELNIKCYCKIGSNNILSKHDYLKIFDDFNLYVCMSKQEGGPLPAMEAMQRGCGVLSTNVGQMPELINNNGFILKENEFFDKIVWIQNNIEWLNRARIESINIMKTKRDYNDIRNIVKNFLNRIGVIC
jgi:glycosyltransferase involved in cell wall biosynthesis